MASRTEAQQKESVAVLGKMATEYIANAQKQADANNMEECLNILKQGIESGAEPIQLLINAHHSAVNGMKKLISKKDITTKPARNAITAGKPSGSSNLERSAPLWRVRRFKNLGPPVRPVKSTPKISKTQKISLTKLEESPQLMSYLDAPSPLPSNSGFDRIKWNGSLFSESKSGKEKFASPSVIENSARNQSSISSNCLPIDQIPKRNDSPLTEINPSNISQSKEKRSLVCGKENYIVSSCNKTEPAFHSKNESNGYLVGNRSASKAMQPFSNCIEYSDHSSKEIERPISQTVSHDNKDIECVHEKCSTGDIVNLPPYEITGETTGNPDTFSSPNSLSCNLSNTFITDQNFFSEKMRCSSDSGFQEIANSTAPVRSSKALASEKKMTRNETDPKSQTCHVDVKFGVNLDERLSDRLKLGSISEGFGEDLKAVLSTPLVSMFGGMQSRNGITSERGTCQPFKDTKEKGMPSRKFDISGIADFPNLSISDDRHAVSSASSVPLSSASSDCSVSDMPRSTAPFTNDNIFSQDSPLATTVKTGALPFKVPPVPHALQSGQLQTKAAYTSQGNATVFEDLMKKKQDAKAAKVKSQSTTKKHRIIRIKKERYKVVSIIGKGGSGKVYEVENDDGKVLAMKCVPLEDLDDVLFDCHCNEIELLWALRNDPFIIRLYEYELKNEKLFMLMEKGEMDLEKYLHLNKSLKCEEIRNLWIQMLCAVNSIHKQGIIHTDLKPANFLFVNSTLKLIDFGIAKGLQDDCTSTQRDCLIGTLNYMAPESVSESTYKQTEYGNSKKNYKIRRATDIWSLGCILYLMVYGKTPFQHIQQKVLKVVAIKDATRIAFPDLENKDLCDTIKGCLQKDPRQRYTIDQLLAHDFVTKGGSLASVKKPEDRDSLSKIESHAFLHHVKESAISSPKSLQRAQKTMARRRLIEQSRDQADPKTICSSVQK